MIGHANITGFRPLVAGVNPGSSTFFSNTARTIGSLHSDESGELRIGGGNQPPNTQPEQDAVHEKYKELIYRPLSAKPEQYDHAFIEYIDELFDFVEISKLPREQYETLLRRRIGEHFAKGQISVEALDHALNKFGLDIEDQRPGRTALLRGAYLWPKDIREGIYRRSVEAYFNSDPQEEGWTVARIEKAAQRTIDALQTFFEAENAPGIKNSLKRTLAKRRVLIAFKDEPVKFEFEGQPDHEKVLARAKEHFRSKIEGIRASFALNRNLLNEFAKERGLKADVERIRRSPFKRFLSWYHRMDIKSATHHYLTGVGTAASAYVGGSILAKFIAGAASPVTIEQLVILGGLSLYYGWETPVTLDTIDCERPRHRYPDPNVVPEVERHNFRQAVKKIFTPKPIEGIKEAWLHAKNISKMNQVGKLRAAAYMFGISPSWTVRHSAFLTLVHAKTQTASDIVFAGMGTWLTTLPPVYLIETFIQGRIPLRYRFLTQAGVITAWHTVASLFTLLS